MRKLRISTFLMVMWMMWGGLMIEWRSSQLGGLIKHTSRLDWFCLISNWTNLKRNSNKHLRFVYVVVNFFKLEALQRLFLKKVSDCTNSSTPFKGPKITFQFFIICICSKKVVFLARINMKIYLLIVTPCLFFGN